MSDKKTQDITAALNQGAAVSKEWLEDFLEFCRDPEDRRDTGLRKAARALGISHPRLKYLMESDKLMDEQIQIAEKVRKLMKMSDSAIFKKMKGKK